MRYYDKDGIPVDGPPTGRPKCCCAYEPRGTRCSPCEREEHGKCIDVKTGRYAQVEFGPSHPTGTGPWVVIDHHNVAYGPFDGEQKAWRWAEDYLGLNFSVESCLNAGWKDSKAVVWDAPADSAGTGSAEVQK